MLIPNSDRIPEDEGRYRFIRDRAYSICERIDKCVGELPPTKELSDEMKPVVSLLRDIKGLVRDIYTDCTFAVGDASEVVERRKKARAKKGKKT
jgi:hypothetical protein